MKQEELTPEEFAEEIKEQLKTYVELRTDLVKAQLTEKVSIMAGKLFAGIILLFVFSFAVLFVSVLAGIYLGKLLDSPLAGFGIVAAFYVVLFVLILFFKKQLVETPVANLIVSIIYSDHEA